ncbi:hypothetical protein FQR65_LT14167 [Abscondita terminalis]|nr:hypothetical protein FQR65_LT14165 [Abscondita terminalis]KAF5282967.1 hypothetical protein FQR65_LT14167 [Abscondita terminalis]
MAQLKPRLLTGDTPTGKLHLGHWVGSLALRVALQKSYDCYFIIANIHAFTTRAEFPKEIRQNTLEIALDYLAAGIDPKQSHIFVQSEVPAIAELTCFFSMLISFPRVMRNPTIKDEIRQKNLGDNYPFGFLLYPVGEDQIAHLELARECARRFNQIYCGVDPQTKDENYVSSGGLFPIVQPKLSPVHRLIGTGPPNADGIFPKMSKSLNNAIYLSDDPDTIKKKVMSMYTDPRRLRATDPGTVENNPLWIFHDVFNPNKDWVIEAKDKYRKGQIKDVECKHQLVDILLEITQPMRERRKIYENELGEVLKILNQGTEQANKIAEDTLEKAKIFMKQDYFKRTLKLKKS